MSLDLLVLRFYSLKPPWIAWSSYIGWILMRVSVSYSAWFT